MLALKSSGKKPITHTFPGWYPTSVFSIGPTFVKEAALKGHFVGRPFPAGDASIVLVAAAFPSSAIDLLFEVGPELRQASCRNLQGSIGFRHGRKERLGAGADTSQNFFLLPRILVQELIF
jgi:hypothetical protein